MGDKGESELQPEENTEKKSLVKRVSLENDPAFELLSTNLSFDTVLSQKIGFGKCQIFALACLGLSKTADGAIGLFGSFLITLISSEWGITSTEKKWLSSAPFIGYLGSSFLLGPLSDKFGRKIIIQMSIFTILLFGILTAFSQGISYLIVFKTFFGFGIGLFSPLGSIYLAEVVELELRGRVQIIYRACLIFGELLVCGLAFAFLKNLHIGNWRDLLLCTCIPIFFSFLLSFSLEESPRYLLLNGEYDSAFKVVENMIKLNKTSQKENEEGNGLSDFEKKDLINWAKSQKTSSNLKHGTFGVMRSLFSGVNFRITISLWYLWFYIGFVYNGLLYSVPLILEFMNSEKDPQHMHDKNQEDILKILYLTLAEIPAALIVFMLIEIRSFGRKNTIFIASFLTSLFAFLAFTSSENLSFAYTCLTTKIFLQFSYLSIYPLTAEVYPTSLRSTGFGLATCFKRIATIVMPWIIFSGLKDDLHRPFLIFSFLSLGGIIAAFILPFDTVGMELDKEFSEEKKNK